MADIGRRRGDSELILALAAGETVRDAAKRAGVSERTAHRRLDGAEYRRRVIAARREMFGRAMGLLADGAACAVSTLRGLAETAKSESVRLNAAKGILDVANRWREVNDLSERVAELEEQLNGLQSNSEQTNRLGAASFRVLGRRR